MDVNGGKLDFTATLDNSQIVAAIEETIKRVQGLSDGTASAGESMQEAFDDMEKSVVDAISNIQSTIDANTAKIEEQTAKITELGNEYADAMSSGDTALAHEKEQLIVALQNEREALTEETHELEQRKTAIEENTNKLRETREEMTKNGNAQASLRQRIKEVKDEMAALVIQAQQEGRQLNENTGRYAELRDELGRLTDVQSDLSQQAKILSNDEAQIAGVINGLSGLSAGFSAVTGTISLFAGENENLQKVMTKLQSVMAITMGLQQLQQTLNKDSAFRLTTLASIKKWWGDVEAEANAKAAASTAIDTAAKESNTVAQTQNAGAKAANKVATDANTTSEIANVGATELAGKSAVKSAGFFRILGTAIKSVPGFGWLIAGATALGIVAGKLIGKEKERKEAALETAKAVKEAQEEERKEINKSASENIAKIEELSRKYKQLGGNFNEQRKFIDANKEAFRSLGVEISTVNDATQLLIDKKDEYVRAQLEYAKADVYRQRAKKLIEENADMFDMYDKIEAKRQVELPIFGSNGATYTQDTRTEAEKAYQRNVQDMVTRARQDVNELFDKAFHAETIAENLTSGFKKATTDTSKKIATTAEEILSKQLAATKARYEQFYAWINSGDKDTQAAARTEFADLVEKGNSYLEYLKKQRKALIEAIGSDKATEEQASQMRILNEQIAQETKDTVLSQFEAQLQSELQGAQSLIDMLDIIKRKREELKQNSTGNDTLDEEQEKMLNEAEQNTQNKIAERTKQILQSYRDFSDQLVSVDKSYLEDVAILERQIADVQNDEERERLKKSLEERRKAYDKARQDILDSEARTLSESSDAYQAMFNNAQSSSKKLLQVVLEDAETILRVVRGSAEKLPIGISQELVDKIKQSPREIKELANLVSDLKSKLNEESGYPFASLVQGFKMLEQAREEYASASKETSEEIEAANRRLLASEESARKKIIEGFAEAASKIEGVGSQIESLGNSLDDSRLESIGKFIKGIASIGESVMNGYANGGWIGAVSSGVESLANTMMSMMSMMAQQQHEAEQSMNEYRNSVELLNLTLQNIYDNGFGTKFFEQLRDASEKAEESLNRYNEAAASINGDRYVFKDHGWWDVLWGGDKMDDKLSEVVPELFNEDGSLNIEALRNLLSQSSLRGTRIGTDLWEELENILNLYDKYLENYDKVYESIKESFSYLGQDALTSLTDAIISGGDAWEDWRKKGAKAIESLGEKLMYEIFLAKNFDTFAKTLDNIYSDKSTSSEEKATKAIEAMDLFMDEMEAQMDAAQMWGEAWRDKWKERGFDVWTNNEEDSGATSFSGAVKTVSETTASIISGQMNAMRVNQVNQGDILRQQLLMLSSIKSDTAFLRSIDNRLRNIESATASGAYQNRLIHQ